MARLPELTERQRQAAVERCRESLALTSGAGCGKTLVLARRFTTLLLTAEPAGTNPFDRFVALTFTEKAALEMTARVRAVLLEALSASADQADRRKLAEWITELPAAHISTIHGFCAGLLRRYAVEAGVDPAFSVLADELLTAQMQAEAAENAVLAAADAGREDALDLIVAAGFAHAVEDVQRLLDRRIAWRAEDYADPETTLARWRRRQAELRRQRMAELARDEATRAELRYLAGCPCASERLAAYRDEKLRVIRGILNRPEGVSAEDVAALSGKPGNLGGAKLKDYRDRLREFVVGFASEAVWFAEPGEADALAARSLAALTALADRANALYAAAKRSRGVLDFEDLIDLTARLLRESPPVREDLRRRLGQLLIDECQDTDAYQLRMLWELVGAGGAGEAPPEGLFVVGDLKQSIYRFRGAQAEVFRDLCRQFGKDARVPLSESFRTHLPGVAFVNHLFERLMAADYEPIRSSRKELPPAPSVEILLAECAPDANADAVAAAQAELVAERIRRMIGRQELVWDEQARAWRAVRAGDVAILFARMTKSLEYERALQQRGLPYYVVAGTGFFQQQEIYDCLNALRAIDNPYDDVALCGLLRSGVFGLDDNVLLNLALADEPPYFDKLAAAAVRKRLPPPAREQLAFARELLARLHRDKDALGAAALIEALLAETGYAAVLLSQFGGDRKLANVHRLVAAARSAQAGGGVALADFVRRFNQLSIQQTRYEQAPVVGEEEDVVRIMTIHKAKGLEFPVVVIPDLNAGFRGPAGRLLLRQDWKLTCNPAPPPDEDGSGDAKDRPVSFRLAGEAEKAELAEEDVRKLYVAVTRHRDHLVLVGADRRHKDGTFRDRSGYLARLDEVLHIADAVDGGTGRVAYAGGEFHAVVERIKPTAPPSRRGRRPLGARLVEAAADGEQLASALARAGGLAGGAAGALLGPLPPAAAGPVAPTALADFAHCPMLYRWRHELRVPAPPAPGGREPLDAATAGTLFHRCMELVDFDAALPAQAGPLLRRAAGEMDLPIDPAALSGELAEMLEKLQALPLLAAVRAARQRLPELTFAFRAGGLDLSGQIDLLYQDAAGAFHVVDYKSDRLGRAQVGAHARRYELQMMIYLAAARRHFGPPAVADATLYFLRPGREHRFAPDEQAWADFQKRLAALADELARCRHSGVFARRGDAAPGLCPRCPYRDLCRQ